ncbi:Hypothetical predicted protein, partial [Paramuricea clavata]
PLSQFAHVSLGPWVGHIYKEYSRVVMWLKNGSRCSIEGDMLELFSDALDKRDSDCPFYNSAFYPSQSVVGPAQAFNDAKWLTKIKPILVDQSKIKAVVQEAKVVQLEVNWQVCGSLPPGCKKEDYEQPPDRIVTEENIDKVKVFHQHCHQVQIGDKCFYVVKEEDIEDEGNDALSTLGDQEASEQVIEHETVVNGPSTCDAENEPCEELPETSCEQTTNNVSNQDSVTSLSQVTISLASVTSEDDTKHTTHESDSDDGDVESDGADQSKLKTSKQDLSSKPSTRRRRKRFRHKRKQQLNSLKVKPGDRVCVEIIKTKTRADVLWQDGTLETDVDTLDLIAIYHIDDHQFFPGYIVNDKRAFLDSSPPVKFEKYGIVRSSSDVDRTCAIRWFSTSGEDLGTEDDVSVYDLAENVDMVFNPGDLVVAVNCGNEGDNQLHGVAGQVVCVDPDGYVVVNWAAERDSEPGKHRPHELYKVESEDEDSQSENSSGNEHSSGNEAWETASEDGHVEPANEDRPNVLITSDAPIPQSEEPTSPGVDNVDIEALNNANNTESQVDQTDDTAEAFLMLSEVHESHHYYADHFVKNFSPNKPRKFMSVVRKEMLLLRSSLPSGILIRGFENAMELFTALISGPKDTPYEGGVFLFDIKLPSDYPASPPSVFFISMTSNVLNPNLYVDGTVCTSLLGTWSGRDSESWTEKSNLLQVLLSIQALILCKDPYFNEAGYEKHRGTVEGIENSRVYNEMAILNLISSMTASVKSKHAIFDKEIRKHFQEHGQRTIVRYKSWLSHSNKLSQSSEDGSSTLPQNDCTSSETVAQQAEQFKTPDFPLFPVSKGFCKCLERNIELFNATLVEEKLLINEETS